MLSTPGLLLCFTSSALLSSALDPPPLQKELEHHGEDDDSTFYENLTYDEMIEDIITIYSNDRGGSKLSAQFIDKVEAKAGEAISQMQAAADEGREGRGGKSPRPWQPDPDPDPLFLQYGVQSEVLDQPLLVGSNKELHYSVLVNTPHGRHLLLVSLLEQLNTNYWSNRCGGKLKLFLPNALRNPRQPPPPRGACRLENIVENDQILDRDMVKKKFDKIVPTHENFEDFSWFKNEHKHYIEAVAKWIIESDSFGSAYSLLVLTKDWLPKRVFVELVNLVIIGREDTGFTLPSIESYMPEDFFDKEIIAVPASRNTIDHMDNLPQVNQIWVDIGSGAFGPDDGQVDDYSSDSVDYEPDNRYHGPDDGRYHGFDDSRYLSYDGSRYLGSTRSRNHGSDRDSYVPESSARSTYGLNHDDVHESEEYGSLTDHRKNTQRSGRISMWWNQFGARVTTSNRRIASSTRTFSPNIRTASRRISTVTRSTIVTSTTPRTRATSFVIRRTSSTPHTRRTNSTPRTRATSLVTRMRRTSSTPHTSRTTSTPRTSRTTSRPRTWRTTSTPRTSRTTLRPRTWRTTSTPRTSWTQGISRPWGTSGMIWTRTSPEESEWYYREDPVANAHHVDWHRINSGHRRGEFFYHMHGQMLARYEAERLSLGLGLTRIFGPEQWDRWIEDEYDPRLGGRWRTRRPGTIDTRRMHSMRETVEMLAEFTSRYSQGVDQGIDRFGGVFERGLHNTGHVEISLLSGRRGGVMGSSGGAMRDPIFYRWHAYVQSVFQQYKNTLVLKAPYTDTELSFPGVRVESCSVQPDYGELDTFYTYREMASVRLDSLDSTSPGSAMSIQYMRMNHRPFHWNLVVHSDFLERTHAIVRIFMMPTMEGVGNRATIHMDHFYIELTPGTNEIRREELEASHLSKSRWSLNELQDHLLNGQVNRADFTWGGCGWPRHLNIPRGTEEGMAWTLVVMVSKILPQDIRNLETWRANSNLAWGYCGVREGLVPDSRPMGFPVDRDFGDISTLAMGRENWHIKQVTIRHGKDGSS